MHQTSRVLKRQPHIIRSQSSSNLNVTRGREKEGEEEEEEDQVRVKVHKKKKMKYFVPTVPEPFEMTVREETKRRERELARQYVGQSKLEDTNNLKNIEHFKAIEMPSHVKEKRYEKLVEKQEKKKKQTKEEIYLEIKNKIKPFSFVLREEKKSLKRSNSSPNLKCSNCNTDFRANPFPEHLFTDFAQEQKQERENYREIQKKLRQEFLLKNSSFPPRMGTDFIKKKLQENKELAKANKSGQKAVRRERTDLDRLYRQYRENMERKQTEQKDKMILPTEKAKLHLRESKIRQRPRSSESLKKRPRSASNYSNLEANSSIEKSYNLTTQLRIKLLEEKQLRSFSARNVSLREEAAREERARRRRINNPVWENIRNEQDNRQVEELTRARLEQEKIRMKNFKLEMEEMMRRVENQPTLFQKQSQVIALNLFDILFL